MNTGAAVGRGSNISADLPTDASGFTARWLSCEGEGWFASFLWYFQHRQVQHTQHWGRLCDTDAGDTGVVKLWYEFVNPLWEEWSPERQCVPLTSWCAFLRWNRREREREGDCISCCWWLPAGWLLADTADWYNVILQQQRHSKSVWNAAVSPPGDQRTSTMQSVWEACHCHCRLEVSQIRFTFSPKHSEWTWICVGDTGAQRV